MGLIKSSNSTASLAPFSMKDIETAARSMLMRAQQQADQLLAEAQAEAVRMRESAKAQLVAEARREGLAQGIEQGREAGRQEALAQTRAELQYGASALASAASVIETSRADLNSAALQEVVRLAVAIARRITKRQGILDPNVLIANLDDAMKLVSDASDVRVAIHPSQRATLDAALPQLGLSLPSLKHVDVVEDASISPGGCRVFTRNGQIDADLEVQLDRIIADLLPRASEERA